MKNPPPIYYLSCLPGVGKTRLAVQKMIRHLQRSDGLVIYVAPTILLLSEVRGYLEKDLEDDERKKIRIVVSEGNGGTVTAKMLALMAGLPLSNGETIRPLLGGSVILMTHKGFLSLPDTLPRKSETTVIFDEAHKFTAQLQPIALKNNKERKMFKRLIDSNSQPLREKSGKDTGFKKFKLDTWPSVIKKITHSSSNRKQYAHLSDVVESAMSDRADVYVKENSRKGRHSFYEVTMPARIFDDYKLVILMSAFLEDTQMWHLLKQSDRVLLPLWLHPQFKKIKPRIDKFTDRIKSKFSRVCIFPLTPQDRPLSLHRMDNAVMVPANKLSEIRHELESLKITSVRRLLDIARRVSLTDPTDEEKKALRILKKNGAKRSPFKWYLSSAMKFVNKLREEGNVKGRVLVTVNDRNIKLISDLYPDLTRISTVSHGLNRYLDSNTLIFTAALNPEPEMVTLYSVLLPDYDYARDHLADSCTQAVTRLCVRDVDSEVIAYVILPDRATADLLRSKMLDLPSIANRAMLDSGSMTALSTINPERKTERHLARERMPGSNKHERWRANEVNKQLDSKRASRSRLKRYLKADPTRTDVTAKIARLDAEISRLVHQKESP